MTHVLTKRQKDALAEFAWRPRDYVCPWKPVTMASLADIGLVEPVHTGGEVMGYRLTNKGLVALEEEEEDDKTC